MNYGYLMEEMDRLANEYETFEKEYEFAKALGYLALQLSEEISKEFDGTRMREAGKLFSWMNSRFIEIGNYINNVDFFVNLYYLDINNPNTTRELLEKEGFGNDYEQFDKNLSDYDYEEIIDAWIDVLYELFSNSQSPSIYESRILVELYDRYNIDKYISKLERSL